jgi:hypothetical protein
MDELARAIAQMPSDGRGAVVDFSFRAQLQHLGNGADPGSQRDRKMIDRSSAPEYSANWLAKAIGGSNPASPAIRHNTDVMYDNGH